MSEVRKGSMGTIVDHGGAELKWNVNSFWHFDKWYCFFSIVYDSTVGIGLSSRHVGISELD